MRQLLLVGVAVACVACGGGGGGSSSSIPSGPGKGGIMTGTWRGMAKTVASSTGQTDVGQAVITIAEDGTLDSTVGGIPIAYLKGVFVAGANGGTYSGTGYLGLPRNKFTFSGDVSGTTFHVNTFNPDGSKNYSWIIEATRD